MQIPPNVKNDIKDFIRIDDAIKTAQNQMSSTRNKLKECRSHIIDFMVENKMTKFEVCNGDYTLLLRVKDVKIRPTFDDLSVLIKELVKTGVNDQEKILEHLYKCGGTKTTYRLARRNKRKRKPETNKDLEEILDS